MLKVISWSQLFLWYLKCISLNHNSGFKKNIFFLDIVIRNSFYRYKVINSIYYLPPFKDMYLNQLINKCFIHFTFQSYFFLHLKKKTPTREGKELKAIDIRLGPLTIIDWDRRLGEGGFERHSGKGHIPLIRNTLQLRGPMAAFQDLIIY